MIELLRSAHFRQYSLAKFLQMAGQNALIYGLFILVIDKQQSSLSTSLFLLCGILPSVLLSLPGGSVADALPNKLIIVTVLLLRMAIIVAFVLFDLNLATVLGLTVLVWVIFQFYSPAESAALVAVTPPHLFTQANSVMYVINIAAQLAGAGIVAPLMLKTTNEDGLFIATLLFAAGSAWFFLVTGHLSPRRPAEPVADGHARGFLYGFRFFRGDAVSTRAMVQHVLLGSATTMVLVAIPSFVDDVLDTSVINAIYIFSPGAGGVALGLGFAPLLTRVVGGATTSAIGFIAFALVLGLLANLPIVEDALQGWSYFAWASEHLRINPRVATTMLVVPLGGFGIALVNVASKALLYERAPHERLGQLFATQSAISSVASIIPALAAGVIVDHVDVRYFTGAIAALLLVSLLPVLRIGRAGGRSEQFSIGEMRA